MGAPAAVTGYSRSVPQAPYVKVHMTLNMVVQLQMKLTVMSWTPCKSGTESGA